MTKAELAKRRGEKENKNTPSPSEALITSNIIKKEATVEKPVIEETKTKKVKNNNKSTSSELTVREETKILKQEKKVNVETKRGPGKPKKRKDGDRRMSFWLDEDLVLGLFDNLKYGETAGELINDAIREYQKKHKTYKPK